MNNFRSNHHGKRAVYSAPVTKVIDTTVRNNILQDIGSNTDSNPERDG